MNTQQDEYLNNWLFRAKEDIAVIDNLYKQILIYMPVQSVFMLSRQLKIPESIPGL